jgi:type IV secretion system protein TrbL
MAMDTQVLNTINFQFLEGFQKSMHAISAAGSDLAYWLAYITLTFTIIMMLLQGEEINKVFSKLVQMGMLFGIFFGMISLCGTWVPMWLNGFMYAGGKAANLTALDPSSIFDQGFFIASKIAQTASSMGIMHLFTAFLGVFAAIFVIIIYALIAADLAVTLIKSFALVAVGPIIFAFGMNDVTRPTVTNYVNKLIGMGLQLLMIYVIIGVGISIGDSWVTSIKASAASGILGFGDIAVVMGGLTVFYMVTQSVPSFIATLSGAGGFRNYGAQTVATAMGAAAMSAKALSPTNIRNMGANMGGNAMTAMSGAANAYQAGKGTLSSMINAPKNISAGVKSTADAFKGGGAKAGFKHVAQGVGSSVKNHSATKSTSNFFKPKK